MTRKLQHLLSRATLLLLLFFVSGVTYAQIAATVKCEIRGDGSANLNGLNNDFTNFDFPIVSGETYTFEQLYGIPGNNTAITIGSIQGTLVDILVDGEHNEYSWSRFQSSGGYSASLLLTAENNYYAELTLVFEGGEEPEVTATQTYTVNVVGSGTVDYSYTSESGEVKTGTFVPGEATALDNMSMGAAYIIDITPKPDEGYKFAGMTMNGEEVADALQQYEELGMVTLETSAAEVNLEVTFKEDVPEYNVTYTVTVEGEGTVDYSYYIDGSDTWEKATGTFDLGVATGLNPKKIGPNYGVDIYPKPAEGYKFVKATVNGEEKTDALSKYDSFKFFPVNSDAKEIALHLVFEKEVAEAPYTYTLTVEGEGTVRYDYWNPETNSMVEGAFEPGVALPVYSDQYGISVYPEPAEGYVFKAAYLNDVELTEAPGQYETFNYFAAIPTAAENNLKVVFEKAGGVVEDYDMIVNYEVEGEGSVGYFYFVQGMETAEGNLVVGDNVFPVMYKSMSSGYNVTFTPVAAEGYTFKALYVNGNEVSVGSSGYKYKTTVDQETVNVKAVFVANDYDMLVNLTVEGKGSVGYSYLASETETATGTLNVGENKLSMFKTSEGYSITLSPEAEDGFELDALYVNDSEVTLTADGDYVYTTTAASETVNVRVVFAPASGTEDYDMLVTYEVEGEGSVGYFYYVQGMETAEGNLAVGENVFPVMYKSGSFGYAVTFTPVAAEGYKFKALYINGTEVDAESGYRYTTKVDRENVSVKAVFESELPEDYDMIVNYEVEGEGQLKYFYFVQGMETAEGYLAVGQNVFPVMYKNSSVGYAVTFTPEPANGNVLKALYINGTEVNVGSDYRYTTKVDQETVNVKAVFGAPAATLTFEAEAEGGKVAVTDAEGNALESGNEYPVGTVVNIAVTPAENFALKALTVNGTEVAAGEPVDGTYNVSYTLVEGDNNIVAEFETTLEPDMYVNLTIEGGEGHVEYWYYLTEPLDAIQEGVFNEGVNKLYNIYYSSFTYYSIRVTVVPAEGYTLKSLYIGQTDYSAWYGANEEFSLMSTSQGDTYELTVTFEKEAEKADMIVNYSQEGNGRLSYYYYTDDADASGYMNDGANEFWDMYCDSYGNYKMYLTAVPEDGSVLKSLTVDGVDKTAEYNESGNLMLTSTGGQTYDVKAVFEEEAQEPTGHKVVIKANGDVEYYIKFSNTEAQRQEFYYVLDKDTTVYLPDNAFCAWNYTYNSNFTVKGLVINGEPLLEPSFYVNSDLEISLDYVVKDYFELEYDKPENGEVIVEYQVWDMDVKDYVYVPYEAGMPLETGTGYRVTYVADENSYIASIKVNGEVVMTSTVEEPVYEYTYEGKVWGQTVFEAEILSEISVDEVAAEPVQMTVYSVDGVLVRSCLAKDAKEAVEGLEKGLYIVNGQKILVK